jgi:hypothetical protein
MHKGVSLPAELAVGENMSTFDDIEHQVEPCRKYYRVAVDVAVRHVYTDNASFHRAVAKETMRNVAGIILEAEWTS